MLTLNSSFKSIVIKLGKFFIIIHVTVLLCHINFDKVIVYVGKIKYFRK